MKIISATPNDHRELTQLTFQSKAYWNYSTDQMDEWREVLTIKPEYIAQNQVYKLVSNHQIIAYYSFFSKSERSVLLDNFFISPKYIGKGFGRLLLLDFLERAKSEGNTSVSLYSDPHSEQFYLYFGFEVIGQENTSIPGRFLPIMRKMLD